jgi:hypothetical protein
MQARKIMPMLFVHIRLLSKQRKVHKGRKQKHITKLEIVGVLKAREVEGTEGAFPWRKNI